MELNDDQFARLGLEKRADLSGFLAEKARTYEVRDLRSRPDTISDELIIKTFDLSSLPDPNVTWDTGRWSTGGSRDWTTQAQGSGGNDGSEAPQVSDEAVADLLQFNWILGENSLGVFTPAILEVGMIDRTPYFIREHFSKSAQSLIETNVVPSHDLLFHLTESVGAALAFLHQSNLNVPHGNLNPSNILIAEGNLKTAPIVLSDAVRTQETIRRGEKTKDLQSLGAIILQLLTWEKDPIPVYEALNRAESANYEKLGKQADKWRVLICRLLDGSSYKGNPETGEILRDWLAELRPSKSPVPTIPGPKAPSPAGPNLGGTTEKEVEGSINDALDTLINEHQFREGLESALAFCRKTPDDIDPATWERLNFCANHLSEDDLRDSNLLVTLEEAATMNSGTSALRLGLALMGVDRDQNEALQWLEKAAELGEPDALQPLALLWETGHRTIPLMATRPSEFSRSLRKKFPAPTNPMPSQPSFCAASRVAPPPTPFPSWKKPRRKAFSERPIFWDKFTPPVMVLKSWKKGPTPSSRKHGRNRRKPTRTIIPPPTISGSAWDWASGPRKTSTTRAFISSKVR